MVVITADYNKAADNNAFDRPNGLASVGVRTGYSELAPTTEEGLKGLEKAKDAGYVA